MRIDNISRRHVLKGMAGLSGLVLGAYLAPGRSAFAADANTASAVLEPNLFVSIAEDGVVTIVAHRSEMGQGARTSLPMLVADELEADWSRVKIAQATGDPKYGSQNTDGSRSIRRHYISMRQMGAVVRHMLEAAAAQTWGVDASECEARNHQVAHKSSGKTLDFGALVKTASTLPVPKPEAVTLKDPKQFRYIGKDMQIVDMADITHGRAIYGIDVVVPGMKYVSLERCPVLFGKPKSYDASAALSVPGVEKVVEIPSVTPPAAFKAWGGIAVVASNTWAAQEGRKKLKIEWDLGPNASYDSPSYQAALIETSRKPGDVMRQEGDVDTALAGAAQVVEAEYYIPHASHAQMEPPCAVAKFDGDKLEIWGPTQRPQAARKTLAGALGIPEDNITVNITLLGGGFGRKSKADFMVEAALLSREVGAPVKLTWSREDDIRHGYYHSVSAQYMKAGLDANGKTTSWLHRTVFPSIGATFKAETKKAIGVEMGMGFVDMPFDIPNIRLENGEAEAHVRIGWVRSVANIYHAFSSSSFADELAHAAGRDPVEYLLELMGKPRLLDLAAVGVEKYWNYGDPVDQYPIDTGRLSNVIKVAADKSGWGRKLPPGHGLGIAAHRSFLSYVASVVEVAVSDSGDLTIPRVDMVMDCGLYVNPDRIRSQLEGAVVYGLSLALYGEITAKQGAIVQSNYHDYPVMRIGAAPETHVHIVESQALSGGVGEPGQPPVAPALCNAIYAATGKRIRELPVSKHNLAKA